MMSQKKLKQPHLESNQTVGDVMNCLPSMTVGDVMNGLPSMVVLNDGQTWTALDKVALVFLPDCDEVREIVDAGSDADHIIPKVEFTPPTGAFDLERLVLELPMELLNQYRLEAGRKPEENR